MQNLCMLNKNVRDCFIEAKYSLQCSTASDGYQAKHFREIHIDQSNQS